MCNMCATICARAVSTRHSIIKTHALSAAPTKHVQHQDTHIIRNVNEMSNSKTSSAAPTRHDSSIIRNTNETTPTSRHTHRDSRVHLDRLRQRLCPLGPDLVVCRGYARASQAKYHVATCVLSCVCVLYRRSIASCCLGISPSLLGQSTDAYLAPPHV